MDKKILMKIGDKFKITKEIKYLVGKNYTAEDVESERINSDFDPDKTYEIYRIKGNAIFFEEENSLLFELDNPYVTTKQELERIGINTKIETMKYKVGDIINFEKTTDLKWTNPNPTKESWEKEKTITEFEGEYKIFDITEDFIGFERKDYDLDSYYTTHKDNLNKALNMTNYKVGDTFKFEDVNFPYKTVHTKLWEASKYWNGKYEIFKITKTLIYFDDLGYTGSNFLVMKIADFNKFAILGKQETKKVVGYKLLKDSLNADAGLIFDLEGKCTTVKNLVIEDKTINGLAVPKEKLLDTVWFSPIYEEEFKIGDYIIHKRAKEGYLPNCPRQVGRINETLVYYKDEPLNGITISNIRKATEEEIKENSDNKRVIKNLGSNNITLRWDGGNKLIPEGFKTDFIALSFLQDYYQQLLNVKVTTVGTFNTDFADIRFIRIGCATYNNLVSLKEIKNVIDFCK